MSNIPDKQKEEIIESFGQAFDLGKDLSPGDRLADDLGMDSLSIAELLIWLDEEFEVSGVEVTEVRTLADIDPFGIRNQQTVQTKEAKLTDQWIDPNRPLPRLPDGKSIQERFLRQCDRIGKYSAVADEMAGVLSAQLKLRALLLAKVFREYENKQRGHHVAGIGNGQRHGNGGFTGGEGTGHAELDGGPQEPRACSFRCATGR